MSWHVPGRSWCFIARAHCERREHILHRIEKASARLLKHWRRRRGTHCLLHSGCCHSWSDSALLSRGWIRRRMYENFKALCLFFDICRRIHLLFAFDCGCNWFLRLLDSGGVVVSAGLTRSKQTEARAILSEATDAALSMRMRTRILT